MNDCIGIDISKSTLDCHRLSDGAFDTFANTKTGFAQPRRWIGATAPARVIYEATGPYHGAFERRLAGHLPLVKVNPLQARRFAQALGTRASDEGALAHDILCPIPGIGEPTAAAILIECPETGTLGRKQIASLAGLAPMTRQSGQWRGQAFIQGGRKFLRDALCMPALVAWSPKRA